MTFQNFAVTAMYDSQFTEPFSIDLGLIKADLRNPSHQFRQMSTRLSYYYFIIFEAEVIQKNDSNFSLLS